MDQRSREARLDDFSISDPLVFEFFIMSPKRVETAMNAPDHRSPIHSPHLLV